MPVTSSGVAQVSGRIQATNATPLAGVHIVARTEGRMVGFGLSDGQGMYAVNALTAGRLSIDVDRIGYGGGHGQTWCFP